MTQRAHHPNGGPARASARRGSTIMIVMWTISIATIIASATQLLGFRQAMLGRDSLERVQARWAARAGVESTIAMMEIDTQTPWPDDAFGLTRDLESVSAGEFTYATYDIIHHVDGVDWSGPMDEHSKIAVNATDGSTLGVLEDITPDVATAILDWIDTDDDPGMLGAESDYYQTLTTPYQPRNGPLRSVMEMELIAGIWGDFIRGEDWNQNNRLDPNENDGAATLPEDEPDGILQAGWGGRLTTNSVEWGATASGLPRLHLRWATPDELVERCGLEAPQADVVRRFGRNTQNTLWRLLSTPLSYIDDAGNVSPQEVNPDVPALTREQLASVLAETTLVPLYERYPGRVNVNTAHPDLIRDLCELQNIDLAIAEELIHMRNSRAEGIVSVADFLDLPDVTPQLAERLASVFTTTSNVYMISARGRSLAGGIEVEIIAVVDRSSLPARILEYREQ
jgi:hypothetical protein